MILVCQDSDANAIRADGGAEVCALSASDVVGSRNFRTTPPSFKNPKCFFVALLALFFLAVFPGPGAAQSGALSVEDAIRAREFAPGSPVRFSPDSRWLAYTIIRGRSQFVDERSQSPAPWFAKGADIYVTNLATNKEMTVTGGQYDNWWPVWSPDSHYLAFLSDRDRSGYAKLWAWNTDDAALRKITDLPARSGPIGWMRDGHRAIFATTIQSATTSNHSPDQGSVSGQASKATVTVYDASTKANSDPWSLADYLAELVLVDFDTGKTRVVVHGQIGTYQLSPGGSHVAFTIAKRFEAAGSQQILFDFMLLNLATGESRLVAPDVRLDSDGSGFSWSPDGTRLCFRADSNSAEADSYFVADAAGGDAIKLTAPVAAESFRGHRRAVPLWGESGHNFYFLRSGKLWRGDVTRRRTEQAAQIAGREITQIIPRDQGVMCLLEGRSTIVLTHDDERKQDGVYRVNLLTGEVTSLMEKGQCYTCVLDEGSIAVSRDGGKLAFIAEDAAHSSELWISDAGFGALQQVTHLNSQFDPHLMGTARLIDWLSDDGDRLKGALLLPSNFQAGKRYPLVAYIYGGSFLSNQFDRFGLVNSGPLNMQLLATRGYAVLLPDAPQRLGTPMLDLAKTILPGISRVIELGIGDPERLAVIGHSYGGYSALSLLVQTTRFKAAISIAGGGDLLSLYGEMGSDGTAYGIALTEHGQGAMGGTPWERRDRFIENSPIFYFDRIQTPLLIVQGTDDTAVAPFIGDQTFVALRRLGKEVEYAKYEGEGHSPAEEWRYANQVDFCYRMLRWLDNHLKPESSSFREHEFLGIPNGG
jgi:dipeptidyl aminopeptidase/acylaminoacyl peptidase